MKRIKVLNVIWSMKAGGAQQVVLNYLRDFKDDPDIDFSVCVYTAPTNSKYDQEIRREQYRVSYLNNPETKIQIPYIKRFFQRGLIIFVSQNQTLYMFTYHPYLQLLCRVL